MNPRRLILGVTTAAAIVVTGWVAANPRRSSARYLIVPETVDAGGGRLTSADYQMVVSISPGGSQSSARYLAGTGYAAQLADSLAGPCQEYLDWVVGFIPGANDPAAEPDADDDLDGLANVIEFAFNLDPTSPDNGVLTPGVGQRGLPSIRSESIGGQPRLTIEFIQRRNSCATYAVETSGTLSAWSAVNASPIGGPVVINADYERVKFSDPVPLSDDPRRFLRVRVSLP